MSRSKIRPIRESVLPTILQALRRSAFVCCVAWPLFVAGHAHGWDGTWKGGDGKWDEKENWLQKQVPGSEDKVRIDSGTARVLEGVTAGSRDAYLGLPAGTNGAIFVDGSGARWSAA